MNGSGEGGLSNIEALCCIGDVLLFGSSKKVF